MVHLRSSPKRLFIIFSTKEKNRTPINLGAQNSGCPFFFFLVFLQLRYQHSASYFSAVCFKPMVSVVVRFFDRLPVFFLLDSQGFGGVSRVMSTPSATKLELNI